NAVSFVAVLIALFAMRVPARRNKHAIGNLLRGLREGFEYTFGFAPIRALLLLLASVSMLGMSYSVLLPVFAKRELPGISLEELPTWLIRVLPGFLRRALEEQATTLGLLMSSAGVGALAAAIFLAARKTVLGLGRWIMLMPAALGMAMIGLSF